MEFIQREMPSVEHENAVKFLQNTNNIFVNNDMFKNASLKDKGPQVVLKVSK
jgi:hypothetical protein